MAVNFNESHSRFYLLDKSYLVANFNSYPPKGAHLIGGEVLIYLAIGPMMEVVGFMPSPLPLISLTITD